jgi:hypothetical protein
LVVVRSNRHHWAQTPAMMRARSAAPEVQLALARSTVVELHELDLTE